MNSTNVPSNLNSKEKQEMNNPSLFSGQTISNNEGNIEMPPKAASTGISEKAIKIAATKGEILEILVGNCKVNENNTMELENGTTKMMKNPSAYKNIVKDNKERIDIKSKAKQKNSKAQVGMEIG